MSAKRNYWAESLSIAAEECDLVLTAEQLIYMADAMEGSHENYGMAFYSPPSSDRYNQIEREWKTKYEAKCAEFERYQGDAETAVKKVLRSPRISSISIGKNGDVFRHDGRTEQIL